MSQNQEIDIKDFNLFIGENFSKIISALSNQDIKKTLYSAMDKDFVVINNSLSLSELVQKFLDEVLYDKSQIIEKINKLFSDKIKYDLKFYKEIFNNKLFSSIITTNYDYFLEDNFSEYIKKSTPYSITEDESFKIPFYKIFGDYRTEDKVAISSQDIKRLKLLPFYNEFWNNLRKQLGKKSTIFFGINLKDKSTVELLDFILKDVKKEDNKFYFYSTEEEWKDYNSQEYSDSFIKKYSFENIKGEDSEFLTTVQTIFFRKDEKSGDAEQNYA